MHNTVTMPNLLQHYSSLLTDAPLSAQVPGTTQSTSWQCSTATSSTPSCMIPTGDGGPCRASPAASCTIAAGAVHLVPTLTIRMGSDFPDMVQVHIYQGWLS